MTNTRTRTIPGYFPVRRFVSRFGRDLDSRFDGTGNAVGTS